MNATVYTDVVLPTPTLWRRFLCNLLEHRWTDIGLEHAGYQTVACTRCGQTEHVRIGRRHNDPRWVRR